jgi:uncharacterized protein YggE
VKKSKSGNNTPVPRSPRYGRSSLAISRNLNLKEEHVTQTFLGMRLPIEGLTVIGEAAHDVSPEVIELSFDIHSVGLSAAIALQENAAKATHIAQALAALGKTETDITTGGVEVVPILQLPNPSLTMPNPFLLHGAVATSGASAMPVAPAVSENPSLVGYRAVSSIKVVVRNVSRAGEIVDIVTRAGATPNGSIRYLLQDEETLERTLLERAVRRAREKAAVLAAAVGKSTGSPISISEEVMALQPQQSFGNGRHNPFLMPSAGSTIRPPFINGQLTFCARVSVVYQLQ